ncbi:MAG: hypothetical protein KGL39_04280 [Patescibacteria group bacterium]|nr:hypothetical protein [Patescibacteria group bacterium]
MAIPANTYMINYYPRINAGYPMWQNYNPSQYQADMSQASALGFNVVRCFVAATSGAFDFPSPTTQELANLTDFCQRVVNAGMKLRLCLFDWWTKYGYVAGAETWLTAIAGAVTQSVLHSVELQNETAFASSSSYTQGTDSGWSGGAPATIGSAATGWAQALIPAIRTAFPGIPLTLSCTNGTADIAAAYSALHAGTPPDWYEWHCYGWSGQVQHELEAVSAAISGAPLLVGETGVDSSSVGQLTQQRYVEEVRRSCANLGLAEPAPWCLFDLQSSAQFASAQGFGLLDNSGTPKALAAHYVAVPPGSGLPVLNTRIM